MADKRRFELFAHFISERFRAPRIFDVAGGQGRLNEALTKLGRTVTTFDLRHKHLPVKYACREFTLSEPAEVDLLVGMHPDGATRIIIEYAALHRLPFAVVPCCSDNSMPYNPWMRHLAELARDRGFTSVEDHCLPMEGRARVVLGAFE
ncbi:hypothetical protein [Stigmatella erecta]|uniref:Methyltransferase domain-containing protein n=1 Tax=Stigmatella erecta TaxID=83460 RepID=A0A1I0L6T2_9BACT|nr:hypothetical protein [Stigmatella erecta]SEU35551.1 hypothetical protein SAMN05443639_120125 [Stigmatella erecta]